MSIISWMASLRSNSCMTFRNLPALIWAKSRRSSTRKFIIQEDESQMLLLDSIMFTMGLSFLQTLSFWLELRMDLISCRHSLILRFCAEIDWSGFLSSWDTVALVMARNSFSAWTYSYMIYWETSTIWIIIFSKPFFKYLFLIIWRKVGILFSSSAPVISKYIYLSLTDFCSISSLRL